MVNLSIYKFMLLKKAKNQQVLDFYNEGEDLLDTMNGFCKHIHVNIRDYVDSQGKGRTFTLSHCQKMNAESRIISGSFDSAYTGEKGKIKDRMSNDLKFDISEKDLFAKDFFFLMHVPEDSKFGFLIVQRKENHGVKSVFENAFNNFMKSKGVSNYSLQLKQAPPRYFIKNFLKYGKLKEFRLIEGGFKSNDEPINIDLGREERIFKLNSGANDGQYIKDVLVKLFNSFSSSDKKIPFLNKGEFDEIAFVLGYGDTSKTFYIKNQDKIRSNVDVTNFVEFEEGEPTIESLVRISMELIDLAA
jgi:hypothetical protein